MNLISVIVPVYNVEMYLARCIDSLISQTFDDLEIILVNDGSTDASSQICEDYAKKDSRVKVYHQENAGVSVARNKGIEKATGDYLAFVDSDDWLETVMYEKMYGFTKLHAQPEVVMCDFINIKKHLKVNISSNIRKGAYSQQQIIDELYPTLLATEDFGAIPIVSACRCVFKRSLLADNNIRFDAQLKFSEDYLFMAEVMIATGSFYYLKGGFFYNYRQYEESRSKKFQEDWWQNLLYLNIVLQKLLKNNKEYDFTRQLKLQLLHSALFVLNSIANNQKMTSTQKVQALRVILNHHELKIAFGQLSFEKQSRIFKLVLYLIKHQLAFPYLIINRTLTLVKNA